MISQKKNKKNVQIIPPPSNKNYKKINKYSEQDYFSFY